MGRPPMRPKPGGVAFHFGNALYDVCQRRQGFGTSFLQREAGIQGRRLGRLSRGEALLDPDEVDRLIRLPIWTAHEIKLLRIGYIRSLMLSPDAPPMRQTAESLDVVGIGALNFDEIAMAPTKKPSRRESLGNRERRVESEDELRAAMREIEQRYEVEAYSLVLAGGAFSTIYPLTISELGCRAGVVGVSGQPPTEVFAGKQVGRHRDVLEEAGCSCRYVWSDAETGGRCVSVIWAGERVMRTFAGANAHLADHLLDHFFDVADYLCSARVVHLTSLFDDYSPPLIASLIQLVTTRSPRTMISFDPGSDWCSEHPELLELFLPYTDLLFLTERELDDVSRYYPPDKNALSASEDIAKAEAVRRNLQPRASIVVFTRSGRASVYSDRGCFEDSLASSLTETEIVDDTGAGAVFAAGYLAMRVVEGATQRVGALLGLQLARQKMLQTGPLPGSVLSDLVKAIEIGSA